MSEKRYFVSDDSGILARGMSLDDALMFMKAYCEKYHFENIYISLRQESTE